MSGNGQVGIARVYVKDISFESPAAPEVFTKSAHPEVQLEVKVNHRSSGDNAYEVVLHLVIEAKQQEQALFIVELEQAGIFLTESKNQELDQILGIACPSILFPYARQAVDQLLNLGSWPPLMIAPVSFEQLYRERQQQ